jgi:hypothetical protein
VDASRKAEAVVEASTIPDPAVRIIWNRSKAGPKAKFALLISP